MEKNRHIPVLAKETIEFLLPPHAGKRRIIDGTVGFGGHSALVLEQDPQAHLLGIDHDENALSCARERLAFAGDRVRLFHGCFSEMKDFAAEAGWDAVDGILLDIGVSSPQIDDPSRGFSYRAEGPLDMRMDAGHGISAADLLRDSDEAELARIFREYGEIREAGRLAREIVKTRENTPIVTSLEFAALCDRVLGKRGRRTGPPAPTLPFQALRIAVNDELGELRRALESALNLLAPGGRLCVISFHSLEDRIVKRFFQDMAVTCKCPPGCPVCICGWKPKLRILTKKPVCADDGEIAENPRCACAKLRVAEKIENTEIL